MTIKEFCDRYNCDKSGIYKKIQSHPKELEGHITYKKGKTRRETITFDEYAVEFLLPEKYKLTENYRDEISELKTSLYNERTFRNSADVKNKELSNRISELEAKLENAENERAGLLKKENELLERIAELENENSELRKNQKKRIF